LSLGDAYFLDKQYALAAEAYRDFETLHPRHEAIPYALFQLGVSLRLDYVSVDRAATGVEEALEYFTRIIQAYPTTEYAQKAGDEIVLCRGLLARREVFIGDVFWSMGNYQAAWTRYQFVLENYSDIADVSEYARQKGETAYIRYREGASEEVRRKREGSWRSVFGWL
jgi:outer membrane protein assembly factor BamD